MLLELHVRNLALIERADVEFGDGLEILTGETGAGKSIIIGSVSLALGQKAPREIIRSGAEYAYVELVFSVTEEKRAALEAMDVFPDEDGLLIISRKLLPAAAESRTFPGNPCGSGQSLSLQFLLPKRFSPLSLPDSE